MSCLIDLCLSVNMLFYAFLKKFYSFTVAYTIHFSFEYSVQRFFVFCFFFKLQASSCSAGKEFICNAGDLVQLLVQEDPLEKG